MPATYEPIATTTISSATPSYTFSSIPATYTDLKLVTNIRCDRGGYTAELYVQINGNTGANYSDIGLFGNGTSATSARNTGGTFIIASNIAADLSDANLFTFTMIDFFSYAGSTFKTILASSGAQTRLAENYTQRVVGLFRNTAAINSITLKTGGTNILAGTVISLYGIKAA
jgi:hypothetical protein